MPNPILEDIARDIKSIEGDIASARDLIDAMREAGEDVTDLESDLSELEIKKERWVRMLKGRGIEV